MLPPVAQVLVGGEDVQQVGIGGDHPLALIAGPCVIEGEEHAGRLAGEIAAIARSHGVPFIFKSSFDKANRTSLQGFRGVGMEAGLAILAGIRERFGVPVTTDVHLPEQARLVAQVADMLQIPAFLCRQTDLLLAAAAAGRPVNVKKGQFLAPEDMGHVVAKLVSSGAQGVLVTERGTTFGYRDLVVDMRSLPTIRAMGVPVCFDATHSAQQPGAGAGRSGGRREVVPWLARGAVAVGVDALFVEVHDDPDHAPSDGPNMIHLEDLSDLLGEVLAIDRAVRRSGALS